jgi:hypothetical protein
VSTSIEPSPISTVAARHAAAVTFIDTHQAQHLHDDQLIARCASHLMVVFSVSRRLAYDSVLHALNEVQMRTHPAYVDISHSTAYVVHVVDPRDGRTVAFTASELMQLAGKRTALHADVTDASHLVQACGRKASVN